MCASRSQNDQSLNSAVRQSPHTRLAMHLSKYMYIPVMLLYIFYTQPPKPNSRDVALLFDYIRRGRPADNHPPPPAKNRATEEGTDSAPLTSDRETTAQPQPASSSVDPSSSSSSSLRQSLPDLNAPTQTDQSVVPSEDSPEFLHSPQRMRSSSQPNIPQAGSIHPRQRSGSAPSTISRAANKGLGKRLNTGAKAVTKNLRVGAKTVGKTLKAGVRSLGQGLVAKAASSRTTMSRSGSSVTISSQFSTSSG